MNYDLSKLHPIHREAIKQHMATLATVRTPSGRLACDVLYEQYLDLNQTVPDIIGKHQHELNNSQKNRLKNKIKELKDKTK